MRTDYRRLSSKPDCTPPPRGPDISFFDRSASTAVSAMKHCRALLVAASLLSADAALAQRLPDAFFPESITSAADGTLYVGSVIEGSIVRVRPDQVEAEPLVAAGANGLMSAEGLFVDDAASRLYACTGDLGVAKTPKSESALLAFDLKTGAAAGRWVFPGGGFCNDIARAPDGSLLLSDTALPRILRFDPRRGRLGVWTTHPLLGGAAFNGNGIAVDRRNVYLTTFADGRLLRVPFRRDGSAGEPTQVALPRALAGADALRVLSPGKLLVFENDIPGGNGRVTRVDLTRATATLTTIADKLLEPTSGVVRGGRLIVLESQFRKLFGGEKGQAPAPFTLRTITLAPPPSTKSGRMSLPRGLAFPNGIVSNSDGSLFVGSIASGKIWRRDTAGRWFQFNAGSPNLFAVTSLRLDESRGVIWGASPDAAAALSSERARQARQSRIFSLDARTGASLGNWPVPEGGFGNDIALDGKGGIYISDSRKAVVRHLASDRRTWSIVADSLLLASKGLGPAGIVMLPSGDLVVGLFDEGAIMRVRNPEPQAVVERLALSRALVRPDGMALAPDGRIVLAVGGSGEVVSFDPDRGDLRQLASGLRTPVNVDVRGSTACVTELGVTNLAALDTRKPGQAKPGIYCLDLEKSQ